jgi:hypothetical protein
MCNEYVIIEGNMEMSAVKTEPKSVNVDTTSLYVKYEIMMLFSP